MWNSAKRILIVDDDVTVLRLLRSLLDEEYCLAEASTGESALAMLATFDPHLVMLDIMLPGIDGYEICRRIRCNPSGRGIQVAMVSAKSSRDEVLRAYSAGADDYIVKPFDGYELCSRVRLHFRLCGDWETNVLTGGIPPGAPAVRHNLTGLQFRLDSLDSREREAMGRIVEGVPNKTIARQLGVSHRTANRVRAAVFKKMGVASAVDLARMVGDFNESGPS